MRTRPWMTRLRRGMVAFGLALGVATAGAGADAPPVDFGRDVLPILSDRCFSCHGPDAGSRQAELRLDTKAGALRMEEPVIVAGRPDESEFVARIASHDPDEVMPPPKLNRPLTPAQVETLTRWIAEGAKWGEHWSFTPPARPEVPTVQVKTWPRGPIDAFILARLEREGLRPSPEASRESLIRRVTLDLTGLPPTIAEVDAFLADAAPDAYEKVVDRLLASPAYGERMAWDWLEAGRYADSNGYQGDNDRTMWPWRDWVVRAFNANMPFDRFTVEQVAGDLLPDATPEQKLATGFFRNHMINGEGGRIPEENRVDYSMDMSETAGTVWLGLTLNCCRCHDHKFDPTSQKDYYAFMAFFNRTPVTGAGGDPQTAPVLDVPSPEQAEALARLSASVADATRKVEERENALFPRPEGKPAAESPKATVLRPELVEWLKLPPARRDRKQAEAMEKAWEAAEPDYAALLKARREAVNARDAQARAIPRVMVMGDMPEPRDTFILDRGSYEKPKEKVAPASPGFLPPMPSDAPANRLGLARWLVAPENPLTARVAVNRAWQMFFGVGLVKTSDDFGLQGELPSHPELLDWLATEFVRTGWDVKALHRSLVTSAAYRQEAKTSPALAEKDPANRLLARGARFRLPSWMLRDQAMASGGLLVDRVGGPPVRPFQPPGVWEEASFGILKYKQDEGEALRRRSLYTFWRRIVGPTAFFDASPRQVCVVKPNRTNSPLHALTTLNDATYVASARGLADRATAEAGPAPADRIERAFRLVLARRPTDDERSVLVAALDRVRREFAADPASARKYLGDGAPGDEAQAVDRAALAAVGSAILNLDEALTKE
ncbi:DUF1553 domain-containing protein [Tundrisphaera sp. TA3]|uniref:DUF1553 domain-containing protein n=1 Tax=Tundrisphaera sp. TA3 TaxID=3435775 RepID=UPI003EBEF14E